MSVWSLIWFLLFVGGALFTIKLRDIYLGIPYVKMFLAMIGGFITAFGISKIFTTNLLTSHIHVSLWVTIVFWSFFLVIIPLGYFKSDRY